MTDLYRFAAALAITAGLVALLVWAIRKEDWA